MINLEVNQQVGRHLPKKFWQKLSQEISRVLKFKKKFVVSVAIVDGTVIKKLNRVYRGKNKVTDVLSFAENDLGKKDFLPNQETYLGEVIICYEQAARQIKEGSQSLEDELRWLLVHGFLHLLGYDHPKRQAEAVMRGLEKKILG